MTRRPVGQPYFRWSTQTQSDGDSLPRQQELTARWHADHPEYDLAPALIDAGVSAAKGDNARYGRLAEFLQEIKDGIVRPGDVLLVESWDRISRDHPYDAESICRQIWDAGCGIVTLHNGMLYSRDTIRANPMQSVMHLVEAMRGHDESRRKSERIQAAWDRRRASAHDRKRFAAKGPKPDWLDVVDGVWVPNLHKAATVRRLFQLYIDGHGIERIVQTLNRDPAAWHPQGPKNLKGGWTKNYADQILRDRRALGERQWFRKDDSGRRQPCGKPVLNFFPAVLTAGRFHRAQQVRATRKSFPDHGGGPTGANNNLFRRVAYCGTCGSRMEYIGKRYPSYQCVQARLGSGCTNSKRLRYDKLESTLLYWTRGLDASRMLFGTRDDGAQARLDALSGEHAVLDKEAANLARAIARTEDDDQARALEQEHRAVLARRKACADQRHDVLQQLAVVPDLRQLFANVEMLVKRLGEATGPQGAELRGRLRHHLYGLIDRIEITERHGTWSPRTYCWRVHIKFRGRGRLDLRLDADLNVVVARTRFPNDPPLVDKVVRLDETTRDALRHRGFDPLVIAPCR